MRSHRLIGVLFPCFSLKDGKQKLGKVLTLKGANYEWGPICNHFFMEKHNNCIINNRVHVLDTNT